ncbi:MAG: hypothetical protein CSA58_00545, partial [Micrococcales bacterium]
MGGVVDLARLAALVEDLGGLSTGGMTAAARIDLLTALEKVKRAAAAGQAVVGTEFADAAEQGIGAPDAADLVDPVVSAAPTGRGRAAGFAGPGRGRVISDGTRLRRVGDTRSLGAQLALA